VKILSAATVWLPARRFSSTFSPLTSNSVTSCSGAVCAAVAVGEFAC